MLRLLIFVTALFAAALACAQTGAGTIEGFWQDVSGRTLFQRNASAADVMGAWYTRDVGLPYYDTKQIRRSGQGFELLDMRYGPDYAINVVAADEKSIEFTRTTKWSGCRVIHKCSLEGAADLFCALENVCPAGGTEVVEWRGEERYTRRTHCEILSREQALGIPTRCQ